ncbi:hypothetical protein CN373_20345 [Bacillus cereus]|nr:hypothetical protein CN373_20345 [Bacillus cereus]PFN07210.1 hypothetical protein COJ55_11000 [Bacillus cereus]
MCLSMKTTLSHSNQPIIESFEAQNEGIDFGLQTYNLDANLFPEYVRSTLSAKAGYYQQGIWKTSVHLILLLLGRHLVREL